ncbi:BQ2448_5674 [Microbotryum intermedium]|uniref:BQ2448_5674 protein n=1 Tax=Microbotryum intermedium TaxID=269621 RepID=A0A238F763_9BASI|nr:BQ2448_5674 [Microbotryum intermedium]
MSRAIPKLLVVGGNGFVGSSVAKAAVARGWNVVSLSRSGKPFVTPAGHEPAWASKVDWRAGTPFDPSTYSSLLPSCTAVVSTLGILLETNYKEKGQANALGVLKGVVDNVLGSRGNPLAKGANERSYERMNRDAAVTMASAFVNSVASLGSDVGSFSRRSPFVYISAEDIFRPFVPSRYISTKRQAEALIASLSQPSTSSYEAAAELPPSQTRRTTRTLRPIFIRPSLIYHPHLAPATTLPATLFEATSKIHRMIPPPLRLESLFAGGPARSPFQQQRLDAQGEELPSAFQSMASLFAIPPIHVDAVGQAVMRSIEDEGVEGVVDVERMRSMLGFD